MSTLTIPRSTSAVALLAGLLALSACSLGGADPDPTETTGNDVLATRFVACLTAQGQTAKILDDGAGPVGILLPDGVDPAMPANAEGTAISVLKDEEGEWMVVSAASALPADGGLSDAWAACEAELPEFEQPLPQGQGPGGEDDEERIEAALAFADCARQNGYPEWPDPDDGGAMGFPEGLTEDGLRSVLDDCFDTENFTGLAVNGDSAESFDFDVREVITEFLDDAGIGPGDGEGGVQGGSGPGEGD